ncbi:polysaccharide deacetylase family protein [Bacillus shivajii]|uniref:polysaccharide deacetylase family protein n=1 Tax=Bacillus shivajii TaxID=1983719 RepID=UPI001CFA12D0|nr:polysaccharide deacetylase family protein [Bacillus shivajii]UCZ52395.1 polysaccharide deacetylase family protein [Bacillus shivajii]
MSSSIKIFFPLFTITVIIVYIVTNVPFNSNNQLFVTDLEQLNKKRDPLLNDWLTKDNNLEQIDVDAVKNKWEGTDLSASEWGEQVTGVKNKLDTDNQVIALTFDACGGTFGSGYDEALIEFLRNEQVPATLFVNYRWVEENKDIFLELHKDELFTIENHGTAHLPLSVHGRGAWGITGTTSAKEVIDEVMINQERIIELTGEAPRFFRSGTAFYDEVAVEIVEDLGLKVVNYDILGDAGATYSISQVANALLQSEPGSIPLLHMNQPSSGTAQGVKKAIPLLRERGFEFVHVKDYDLMD